MSEEVFERILLLLDEPLSNLDAKLRVKMHQEIKQIQSKFDITMVFVPHDQEEVYTNSSTDFSRNFLGISNHFTDDSGKELFCRPEELLFVENGPIHGTVLREEFLGFYRQYYVRVADGTEIILRTERDVLKKVGENVVLDQKKEYLR